MGLGLDLTDTHRWNAGARLVDCERMSSAGGEGGADLTEGG